MGPITRLLQKSLVATTKQQNLDVVRESRQVAKHIAHRLKFRSARAPDVEALKLTIISAANACAKVAESHIQTEKTEDQQAMKFVVQCEFFCFFVNLVNRQLYTDFGAIIAWRWEDKVGMQCITEFLNDVSRKWDEELKTRLQLEIYDKISRAESIYGSCLGLLAEDNGIYSGDGMFNKLGCRVAELAQIYDPIVQLRLTMLATGFYLKLKFQEKVKNAAEQLATRRIAA